MGDFDAKKLLAENSKLKNERKELSSVLGEEKEMVKYLHGVIKNYEQLLRSDSKRKNMSCPVANRNLTDSEIDPAVDSSEMEHKENKGVCRSRSSPCFSNKVDLRFRLSQSRPVSPLVVDLHSCDSSTDRHNIMHGLQTVKYEVKQQHPDFASVCAPSCVEDDVYLEDLENLSLSSDYSSTNNSHSLDDMNRKHSSKKPPPTNDRKPRFYGETSRTFVGHSRDRRMAQPKNSDQHQGFSNPRRRSLEKTHLTRRKPSNTETGGAVSRGSRSRSSTIERQEREALDAELEELNTELDKIASQLNKYEKSLKRNEKHLSKIDNRMDYLESFALSKESECL